MRSMTKSPLTLAKAAFATAQTVVLTAHSYTPKSEKLVYTLP